MSSRSHVSVQVERRKRACLPVIARVRTVSPVSAASNFSRAKRSNSDSAVVSQTEPHQTPCAPNARAAAICRPLWIPPAANTGVGVTALTISGISTMPPISPVWPPAS